MESPLCTVDDLKRLTSLGSHIDPDLVYNHIIISQQMQVLPILGQALYESIIYLFDNDQLTGKTETLWSDYIVPCLAFCSWHNASPFLNYKTQRTGISTQSTDVLTPVTPEEFAIYSERVANFKTYYCNRLEDYLVDNKTDFPLFRQNTTVQSSGGSFFLGYKTISKRGAYWDKEGDDVTSD